MEPAFSRNASAWPLAGLDVLPLEPDDPAIAVPSSALRPLVLTPANENIISGSRDAPVSAPELEEQAGLAKTEGGRKWPAAVVVSCCLHAAAALAFLIVPGSMIDPTDLSQIQGVDQAGEMVVGNASEDQVSAGDITEVTLVPMVSAKPVETVKAEAVEPVESVQPVEQTAMAAPATETLEPVRAPTMPATIEPTTEPAVLEQEILAAQRVDEPQSNNVIQQSAKAETVETAKTAEALEPTEKIEEITPEIEKLTAAEEIPIPQPAPPRPVKETKPREQKKAETPPKKPAKPAKHKQSAGSGGANAGDSKRGEANGRETAQASLASRGGSRSGIGNAAVSSYPGKIAAKLRRAARNISRAARRQADNNAQVSFVVRRDGDVSSVRLVRSSGSSDLDKTAVAIIRRAAPFPPIPAEANRASWAFTLPIGPF